MANRMILLILSLSFTFVGCKTSEPPNSNQFEITKKEENEKREDLDLIKITHSTWDRESSIVVSFKSEIIQEKMPNIKDYLFNDTLTISIDAMRYIQDYIEKNERDSVKGKLDGRQTFLKVGLITNSQNVEFYTQPKTDNGFLQRLVDTIKASKYEKECIRLITTLNGFGKHR